MLAIPLVAVACGILLIAQEVVERTILNLVRCTHSEIPEAASSVAGSALPFHRFPERGPEAFQGTTGRRPVLKQAVSAFSLVIQSPVPSPPLPQKQRFSLATRFLAVHLIVCIAISVSYLFRCDGAGAMLAAAAMGFGLSVGDCAVIVACILARRDRGWSFGLGIPSVACGWVMATSVAWPLALVWLDNSSSGVAVVHFAGLALWGAIAALVACCLSDEHRLCPVSGTDDSTSEHIWSWCAVMAIYIAALVVAGIFAPAALELQRALVFEVVVPVFLLLHCIRGRTSCGSPPDKAPGDLPKTAGKAEGFLDDPTLDTTQSLLKRIAQLEQEMTTLRAKAGCVSTLAHEVRTPLNALLACCTLLGDTALEAGQRELLELILSCGSQITNN
eukprot:RCo053276